MGQFTMSIILGSYDKIAIAKKSRYRINMVFIDFKRLFRGIYRVSNILSRLIRDIYESAFFPTIVY